MSAAAIDAFFNGLSRMDAAACTGPLAADVVLEEPYGTPAIAGPEAVGGFYGGLFSLMAQLSIGPKEIYACGNRAAVKWAAVGKGKNGQAFQAEGIDIFTFDAAGKIIRLEGYWNPAPLLTALQA